MIIGHACPQIIGVKPPGNEEEKEEEIGEVGWMPWTETWKLSDCNERWRMTEDDGIN